MNFREEYKNSIEIMSPSAEQMARMKKNILEQAKAPEKKAIPFKKIAYIGGAVAACAVISVAAINIIPRLSSENSKLTATESYANMAGAAVGGDAFEEGAYENGAMDAVADHAPEYVADGAVEDYNMDLDTKSDGASFNDAVNEPSFEPDFGYEIDEEAAADDVCCDNAVTDEAEITDAPTSAPTTTTAVNIDSSTDTPTEDMAASDNDDPQISEDIPISDETFEPASGEAENELSFILSADYDVLILNDVEYFLYDDGYSPPADALLIEERSAIDNVEYWFHHYGDDYLVLLCNYGNGGFFEVVGGYMKSE